MVILFTADFSDGLVRIDPNISPYQKGTGRVFISEDYRTPPYAGLARIIAHADALTTSDRATFRTLADPVLTNPYARAHFKLPQGLPIDTDHMMTGQDAEGKDNNINYVSMINFSGACSARLNQTPNIDPPEHQWELMLAHMGPTGWVQFTSIYAPYNGELDGGAWPSIELHWWIHPTDGGAEMWVNGTKILELRGYDTQNMPGYAPGDLGGVKYINFGAMPTATRFKNLEILVDDIVIADEYIGPAEEPQDATLTFNSTPIAVEATVNGTPLASGGSTLIPLGMIIALSVPPEVTI